MYKGHIKALSFTRLCHLKQVISIMSVCVCNLALFIRRANRKFSAHHYIVVCNLSGCTIFFSITSKRRDFRKKKN